MDDKCRNPEMVSGERGKDRKEDRNTQKEETNIMNGEEPFYKKTRVLFLMLVILGSILVMTVSYKNGQLNVGSNLNYGIDIQGGSWLQLQLQGAIAQVTADEGKIVQSEFARLLNDPSVKTEENTINSITFTTSKQTTQKIIDNLGFGKSTVSQAPDGRTRISIQTTREAVSYTHLRAH